MRFIILSILICLLFISCQKESQFTQQEGNYKVEFLFEHDGCKVYRFYDGRTIYYSDCRGRIDYTYKSGGKNKTTNYVETLNN